MKDDTSVNEKFVIGRYYKSFKGDLLFYNIDVIVYDKYILFNLFVSSTSGV